MEQTTPSMSEGSKRDLRKLLTDALDGMCCFSNPAAQKVVSNGGKLKAGVRELLAKLSASDLLESVGTVTTPAIATFRAKEHFSADTCEVKIGFIGDYFRDNFLAGDGKVESDIAEATLRVHKLYCDSTDGPIIAELGGEEIAETGLAQMYKLMNAQDHGQQGILLTNGYANIFYARDTLGVLWAAYCGWSSDLDYWCVGAYPVTDPNAWDAGFQVVSC